MILSGRIAVGGKTLASPAYNVKEGDAEEEAITLDGHPLPRCLPPRLYLFHKPREVLTARRDARSRRACLPDLLPPSLARLKPVGRLDFLSEGLLLLTTSGELARQLELPQNAWQRRYRLRLYGNQDKKALAHLENLKRGIEIEGVRYRPVCVTLKKPRHIGENTTQKKSSFWVEATLTEGKNRELRKIMSALGYGVSRLIRTHFGPFALGGLACGKHKRVADEELRALLGKELSQLTDVD